MTSTAISVPDFKHGRKTAQGKQRDPGCVPLVCNIATRPHALQPDCKNDQSSNIAIDLVDNSPFHLIGSFDGPEGTPYEGGHFQVVRILSTMVWPTLT